MSSVTAIRDYIDFINSTCDSLPLDGGLATLLVPTVKYIVESLKYGTLYLATFQWLRDLIYLPLIVPNLTLSIIRETCYPFESPALNFFSFLEIPAYRENTFIVGLLNSFFACLPISAGHILSGRRLLVQGIPSGLAAGSGMILGQWWFVVCVVMGIRPLLVPWLALEPFNYLLGIGLLINIVYRITHERRIRVVKWSDKRELLQYFLTSLLLSWCEQTSLFQHLGNITVDTGTTLLDSWVGSAGYVGGLLVGSCIFSLFFALLGLALKEVWLRSRAVTSSRLTNKLHTFSLVLLVGFSFASVPYYGFDYLVTNRIGFVSQDTALDRTLFTPATMDDITGKIGVLSDNNSFDTDVSTFDRGLYLQEHKLVPQSFEDLNYQGEYAWTKRLGKYVRHLVKRRAPLAWSNFLKSLQENDNLRLNEGRDTKGRSYRKRYIGNSESSPNLQLLENDAVNTLNEEWLSTAEMEDEWELEEEQEGEEKEKQDNTEGRLNRDKAAENEFLLMFDTSLSPLFINYVTEASVFEKALKKRFAENPLYSLLLRIDIDSFLNRQPASHFLSSAEEETLFQKRTVLGQYYDTLREYNQLQKGLKSFSNRVYNQQFKGSLRVVRRLFSMTPTERRVLKFDQPLFYQGRSPTLQDFPLNFHEELTPYTQLVSPFVEPAQSRPLYAGWDEELRKLVVTNRSLGRSEALYQQLTDRGNPSQGVQFTSWPLPGPYINKFVPHQLGFTSAADPKNQKINEAFDIFANIFANMQEEDSKKVNNWEMSCWPANVKLLGENSEPMAYKRGGFVWPGHSALRFHLGPTSNNEE